jgi:hypothetical protein
MVATAGVTASPAATATVIDHIHALLFPAMGFSFRAGSPVQTLQVPGRSMAVGIGWRVELLTPMTGGRSRPPSDGPRRT